VTGGWTKWHNEGLNDLCLLLNVIEVLKWWGTWHVEENKDGTNTILMARSEGKGHLGRSRYRWKDNNNNNNKVYLNTVQYYPLQLVVSQWVVLHM